MNAPPAGACKIATTLGITQSSETRTGPAEFLVGTLLLLLALGGLAM